MGGARGRLEKWSFLCTSSGVFFSFFFITGPSVLSYSGLSLLGLRYVWSVLQCVGLG